MSVTSLALFDLFDQWTRDQVSEERLLGLRVLWWGRIGKFLLFLAAAVIIAEIVGETRLEKWRDYLRQQVGWRRAMTRMTQSLRWLGYRTRWAFAWYSLRAAQRRPAPGIRVTATFDPWEAPRRNVEELARRSADAVENRVVVPIAALMTATAMALDAVDDGLGSAEDVVAEVLGVFWVGYILIAPTLAALAAVLATGGAALTAGALAWLVGTAARRRPVAIASFTLLCLGFAMDMLGS